MYADADLKSADLKTSMAHKSFPCFDMKLGIYPYCDIFYHVNAVVCSLKSYFDHFGQPTLSPKTLKLVCGLRRWTYDFEYNYRCV